MEQDPVDCRLDAGEDYERLIAEVWASVLGSTVDDPSRNFLDAGGSSLKMMRVHAELMKRLERQIPITAMFEYPSISSFAHYLATAPQDRRAGEIAAVTSPVPAPGRATGLRRKFRSFKK